VVSKKYKTPVTRFSGQQHYPRQRDRTDVRKYHCLLSWRETLEQRRLERDRQRFGTSVRSQQEKS